MARTSALVIALACAAGGAALVVATTGSDDPDAFADREPLPACSAQELNGYEPFPAAAVACLQAGRVAEGAELEVTQHGADGGPVVYWYRTRPGVDGLEVFVDHTRDGYRSVDWERLDCPEATSPINLGTCTRTELS